VCKEFKNNTLHKIILLNFLLKNCVQRIQLKYFAHEKKLKNRFSFFVQKTILKKQILVFIFITKENICVQKTATFTSSTMCVQNT